MSKPQDSEDGLECPHCGVTKSFVTDSRYSRPRRRGFPARRRRRECENGHRFWTMEISTDHLDELISDRDKLQTAARLFDGVGKHGNVE